MAVATSFRSLPSNRHFTEAGTQVRSCPDKRASAAHAVEAVQARPRRVPVAAGRSTEEWSISKERPALPVLDN